MNRLQPPGNWYKTARESLHAAKIYTLGGEEAAWDLCRLLHRGTCPMLSRGGSMINSTKVKDLRGG